MSTTSPQAEAAGEQSAWQAALASQLQGVTYPELQMLLGGQTYVQGEGVDRFGRPTGGHMETIEGMLPGMLKSRDASGKMKVDRENYASSLAQLNTGYDSARKGSQEAISYGALRAGEGRNALATGSALRSAATSLERDRSSAIRNLQFQSASASQADYNKVLQLFGQGANTSLSLAGGFAGASGAALQGLSQNTQMGSTLGGAATGAGIGTSIYPGIGTAVGALVGGAAGYLTSS